jgi:hypothetical protein
MKRKESPPFKGGEYVNIPPMTICRAFVAIPIAANTPAMNIAIITLAFILESLAMSVFISSQGTSFVSCSMSSAADAEIKLKG